MIGRTRYSTGHKKGKGGEHNIFFFFVLAQREEICVFGGFYKGVERIALLFRFQAQSVFDR